MERLFNPDIFAAMGPLRSMTLRFALVRYGAGIVQISGSVAGDVHFRNRFGNCIRPRTKPVNPHSARQEAVRADLSFLAEMWHGVLTAANRAGWEVYADAVPMTNRLGETIRLTGYNHFMRTNVSSMTAGLAISVAAPATLSLPEKDGDLLCSEETIAAQTFTFTCNVNGWGIGADDKRAIYLFQGLPQLVSRNQFAGPWRYIDMIDATEGAAGTGTYAAAYPFALGQRQWFQARVGTGSGRLTTVWQLPTRVIEADP